MSRPLNVRELRSSPSAGAAPHVVILGAGASRAAFPRGDAEGKFVPLMTQLDKIAGGRWRSLIEEAQPPVTGFEFRFAWLTRSGGMRTGCRK